MADFIIRINVNINLGPLLNVTRYQEKNQPTLISIAAQRYERYLTNRFISLSSGGGSWEKLKTSTKERKERRGIADNPEAILREYDVLLYSIGSKIVGKRTYVGYVRDKRHPRGLMISRLVEIHSTGEGTVPVREVLGIPSNSTLKQMVEDVKKQYNRVIRSNRKK